MHIGYFHQVDSTQNQIHIYRAQQPPGVFSDEAARLSISDPILPLHPKHSDPSLTLAGLDSVYDRTVDRNKLEISPLFTRLLFRPARRPTAKLVVSLQMELSYLCPAETSTPEL